MNIQSLAMLTNLELLFYKRQDFKAYYSSIMSKRRKI